MSCRTISRPMRCSRSHSNPNSRRRLIAYAQIEKPVARPWKSPYFSWISTAIPARRRASATAQPPTPPPAMTTFRSSATRPPRTVGPRKPAGHAGRSVWGAAFPLAVTREEPGEDDAGDDEQDADRLGRRLERQREDAERRHVGAERQDQRAERRLGVRRNARRTAGSR